jgi:hypothetical protein
MRPLVAVCAAALAMLEAPLLADATQGASVADAGNRTPPQELELASRSVRCGNILAEGAMILSVTLSGDVLFAS